MINYKQIETFRAVMLAGSMTQAARDLHTSQPNISRIINQLERRIGMRLFERAAGRLTATPEGRAFFHDVERSFVGLRSLENSANAILKRGTGRLRISSVPSMALTLTPLAIKRFSEAHPAVNVSLRVADSVTVAQWVATGYSDIGIASYLVDGVGVDVELVGEAPGVAVLPPEHPLAKRRRALRPDDFDGERFLSLAYGDGTRRSVDHVFEQDHEDRRLLVMETDYAAAICNMVGLGMGVSVVHPLVAESYRHSGIEIRAFEPAIGFPTHMLHPQHQPHSLMNRRFTAVFAECLREEIVRARKRRR